MFSWLAAKSKVANPTHKINKSCMVTLLLQQFVNSKKKIGALINFVNEGLSVY